MPYFPTSDGCRLYYEVQHPGASKPVVVFVNGTAQTSVNWIQVSNLVKDRFQVLTYDCRAQGRSGLGDRELTLELHAADLLELIDSLGFSEVHPVGLSHGAGVALTFAYLYPKRVGRLVLCSATATLTSRSRPILKLWLETLSREGVEGMAHAALPAVFGSKFLMANSEVLDKIVQAIALRNHREGLAAHLRASMGYAPLNRMIPPARIPTLVLSGSDDRLAPAEGARELADLCGGEHRVLSGLGHSLPSEGPEPFARCLLDFLP